MNIINKCCRTIILINVDHCLKAFPFEWLDYEPFESTIHWRNLSIVISTRITVLLHECQIRKSVLESMCQMVYGQVEPYY